MQITNNNLQIVICKFQFTHCKCQFANCNLQTESWKLQMQNHMLKIKYCNNQLERRMSQRVHHPVARRLLATSFCLQVLSTRFPVCKYILVIGFINFILHRLRCALWTSQQPPPTLSPQLTWSLQWSTVKSGGILPPLNQGTS